MPPIKSAFAAAAVLWLLAGPAAATPVVIDPNFNQTPTSGPKFYGTAAWGAAILPGGGPAQNPSYAGSIGPDAFNQWNNGTPGNAQGTVGFLANGGSYIFQAISGFSVGGTYQISLLANGRILDANNPVKPMAALTITSSSSGTLYAASLPPVDLAQTYNKAFTSVTTATFTANAPTVTVRLTNTGDADSTVLLSGFAIAELTTVNAGTGVPEPVSMAMLGAGLLGLAVARRRAAI